MSLEAYKKRNLEVQELLASIESASSTIILHEPFLKKSLQLEKIIKRLKAFLKMLSSLAKLNPLKYREWWHNAYAKPQKNAQAPSTSVTAAATPEATIKSEPLSPPSPTLAPTEKTPDALPPRFFQH